MNIEDCLERNEPVRKAITYVLLGSFIALSVTSGLLVFCKHSNSDISHLELLNSKCCSPSSEVQSLVATNDYSDCSSCNDISLSSYFTSTLSAKLQPLGNADNTTAFDLCVKVQKIWSENAINYFDSSKRDAGDIQNNIILLC